MIRLLLLSLILLATAPAGAEDARTPPASREAIHLSFAPIVKRVAPAVVNVYSKRVVRSQSPLLNDPVFRRFFGDNLPRGLLRERVQNALGSGVLLDPSGLIVTNHHVIADAQQVTVVLNDRREFDAEVALDDERDDLAVLHIDAHGAPLPTLAMGDADSLEVGDLVLAVGDPFGVGQTVTSGIVSALARTLGANDPRSFIQTDAAINPGNSGGALVDLDGKLVGINTAIYSRSGGSMGIGFAIPVAIVRLVLHAAANGGKIVRPWLGVADQQVTSELAEELGLPHPAGVLVKEVAEGSPAAAAGLTAGDVILGLGGHEIEDASGLRFRVLTQPVGRPLPLSYWRRGAAHQATIALAAPPELPARDPQAIGGRNPLSGVTVANLNPAFDDELGFEPTQRGVVVSEIVRGSRAAFWLAPGDIVASVNRATVDSVAALMQRIESLPTPWSVTLKRKGQIVNVTVR